MSDVNIVLGELKDTMLELRDRVTSNERAAGKGQGQPSRSVLDSKAVMNLRTVSTKSEYRAWNEKLVNALATVRPTAREVMDYIRKMIDMGALSVDRSQYDAQPFASERPWESFSEDLYAILIDKAEMRHSQESGQLNRVKGSGHTLYCTNGSQRRQGWQSPRK